MHKASIVIVILAVFLTFLSSAFAYNTMEVTNGGSIEGTVEYAGAHVPKDQVVEMIPENSFCGVKLPAERYVIKDRKIKNVVVYIEDIKAGKPVPDDPVTLTNLQCAFVPHVAIGFKGNTFIERNDDPIPHNIHTYWSGKTLYNIELPGEDMSITKPLTKTGLIEIECDTHHWMHGYLQVFDHPYATVTNEDGEFYLKDVPPGTYTLVAWHEMLNRIRMYDVKVESGKVTRLKLEYGK
jgi:Polysaccharide lyase family 4, domain II